jgi:hypothetical protein
MPDIKRKQGADKDLDQARSLDRKVTESAGKDKGATQSAVKQAAQELKDRVNGLEAGARKELNEDHRKLLMYAASTGAERGTNQQQRKDTEAALGAFAARQTDQLAEREQAIRSIHEAIDAAVDRLDADQSRQRSQATAQDRAGLEQQHQAQWDAMKQVVDQASQAIEALRARDDQRLAGSRREVMVAAEDPGRLSAALEQDADRQESLRDSLDRDATRLTDHLEREADAARNLLGEQELARWRQALGNSQLSDDAIQRVRQEGRRVTNPEHKEAQEALLKGQLMEEIAITRELIDRITKDENDRLKQAGIDAEVRFFAGDKVRDAEGNKLTDGLFAWKDKQDAWHPVHALEAKGGEASARGLEKTRNAAAGDFLAETRKYAQDIVREEIQSGKVAAQDVAKKVEQTFSELEKRQTELGQLTKTLERLASGNSQLYLEGKAAQLANDGRALRTTGLVSEDSRFTRRDTEKAKEDAARQQSYLAASITAAQLNEIARRTRELLAEEEKNRSQASKVQDREADEEA